MKIAKNKIALLLLLLPVLYSCEGDLGEMGSSGLDSLLNVAIEPSGENCSTGGLKVETGLDLNDNGVLEFTEVDTFKFVCNGNNGETSLTSFSLEVNDSSNCENGGLKVLFGIDDNNNNVLDQEEVDNITYVCNGINGNSTLSKMINEPAGSNCEVGGIKVESGIDENRNGQLDFEEINNIAFVCNGNTGNKSLITIDDLSVSSECPNGGIIINSGIDLNANENLEEDEIQITRNICNGLDGASIEEIRLLLVSITSGSAGYSNGFAGEISQFDRRRWSNATSMFYSTKIATDNPSSTAFVELYNRTSGNTISGSTLSTNSTDFINLVSNDIISSLPNQEITLSLRLRSAINGGIVNITGKSELVIIQ